MQRNVPGHDEQLCSKLSPCQSIPRSMIAWLATSSNTVISMNDNAVAAAMKAPMPTIPIKLPRRLRPAEEVTSLMLTKPEIHSFPQTASRTSTESFEIRHIRKSTCRVQGHQVWWEETDKGRDCEGSSNVRLDLNTLCSLPHAIFQDASHWSEIMSNLVSNWELNN